MSGLDAGFPDEESRENNGGDDERGDKSGCGPAI